jgi:hypothetical protein
MLPTPSAMPTSRSAQRLSTIGRVLSLWIAGDVVYATLPIVVLTAITLLLGRSFEHFAEIKEWSFATIVFFGVAIRKFVRLKVEIQQAPRSHKLDAGLQLFVVCLVTSVLVLSLVVLQEMNAFVHNGIRYVGYAQISLFAIGLLSLLISVCAEDVGPAWSSRKLSQVSLAKAGWQLRHAQESVQAALNIIDRIICDADANASKHGDRNRLVQSVENDLLRTEQLVGEARQRFSELKKKLLSIKDAAA